MLNLLINLIHGKMCIYRSLHRLISSDIFKEKYEDTTIKDKAIIHTWILGCNIHKLREWLYKNNKYDLMSLTEIRRIAGQLKVKHYLRRSKEQLIEDIMERKNEK